MFGYKVWDVKCLGVGCEVFVWGKVFGCMVWGVKCLFGCKVWV